MEPGNANNVLLSCLEKNVTKQASAMASPPLSSPSSDPGNLARRLLDAYAAVRNETERSSIPGVTLVRPNEMIVNYLGPAGTFRYYSVADVLDGPTEPTRCQTVFPAARPYWGKV